jgi:hypothetical protein
MYPEPDSQPNPSISASAAHTEYTSPSPGHETSIDSAKPLSSYINNSTSNLQRFDMQILDWRCLERWKWTMEEADA